MEKPSEIIELENFYEIDLTNCFELNSNKEIIEIDLSNRKIDNLGVLQDLHYLKSLNLSNNRITDLSGLENMTELTTLNLSNNEIEDLIELEFLTELKFLDLSTNQLFDISNLEYLNKLTYLNLSKNQIIDFSYVDNFIELKELDLSDNNLIEIPFLDNLTNLSILKLSNNKILDIYLLRSLRSLNYIDLSRNEIKDISILENLQILTVIKLSSNKIEDFSFLKSMIKIEILDISGNQINDITFLKFLKNIKSLDLSRTKLSDYSFLKDYPQITNLYLSGNNISDISFLADFEKLQTLFLSFNNISNISHLKRNNQLRFLVLNGNVISSILILKQLKRLKYLYLAGNNISDISSLADLEELQNLYLSVNKISDIYQFSFILNKKHLVIAADNNPCFFRKIDLKEDEDHYNIIANALTKLSERKKEYILPVKVILLGNTESGKSTLLNYILQESEPKKINKSINSTHILQIKTSPTVLSKKQIPKSIYYDFGGQDYYHGLYRAFLSNNSINIVLWNKENEQNKIRKDRNGKLTQDFNRIYWLNQLKFKYSKKRNYKSSDPIILIQTHADVGGSWQETFKGDSKVFNIQNEFFISLDQIKTEEINSLKISLNYFEEVLKEKIQEQQRIKYEPIWFEEFLSYIMRSKTVGYTKLSQIEKYYKREKKESKTFLPQDLEDLSNSGLILYYKNDSELKDIAWLNPSATIQYIHDSVLTLSAIKDQNGIIGKEDFEKLLDNKLLKLLINQQVIFFDKFDNNYIIPNNLALINEDEKIYNLLTLDFIEPTFTMKFENFIPFGLINRLICQYGDLANKKYYWRNQLLFTKDNFKILIKIDLSNLEILVSIKALKQTVNFNKIQNEIFRDILDLYWDEEVDNNLILKRKIKSISDDFVETIKVFDESFVSSIKSPDDLYLSIDNKNFIHHKTLENKNVTKNRIISFSLNNTRFDEKTEVGMRTINRESYREQSSGLYKNFTSNENIKIMKKIFISYSNEDHSFKKELEKHLKPLSHLQLAKSWSCEEMSPGLWDTQIQEELENSDIVIFMLSINFITSDYIVKDELYKALQEMQKNKNKKIICVLVRDFSWRHYNDLFALTGLDKNLKDDDSDEAKFQKAINELPSYQFIPYQVENGVRTIKAIEEWEFQNVAYMKVIDEIIKVLK